MAHLGTASELTKGHLSKYSPLAAPPQAPRTPDGSSRRSNAGKPPPAAQQSFRAQGAPGTGLPAYPAPTPQKGAGGLLGLMSPCQCFSVQGTRLLLLCSERRHFPVKSAWAAAFRLVRKYLRPAWRLQQPPPTAEKAGHRTADRPSHCQASLPSARQKRWKRREVPVVTHQSPAPRLPAVQTPGHSAEGWLPL